MSLNFYAIQKATEEDKVKMKVAIDNDQFDEARALMPELIHIGKLSGNSKFLFDINYNKYYELNRKSINDFLQKCTIIDFDEVNYSLSEFWALVDRLDKNQFSETRYGFMSDGLNFFLHSNFS